MLGGLGAAAFAPGCSHPCRDGGRAQILLSWYFPAQLPDPTELLPDVNPPRKNANAWPGATWGWAGGAGRQTRAAALAPAARLMHELPALHPAHGPGLSISSMSSREGGKSLHPSSSQKEIRELSHLPAEKCRGLRETGLSEHLRECKATIWIHSPARPGSWSLPARPGSLQEGLKGMDGTVDALVPRSKMGLSPWQPGRERVRCAAVGLSCTAAPRLQPVGFSPCSQALGG